MIDEFFYRFRYAIKESDFDQMILTLEWPKKMDEIMKESQIKSRREHKEFEMELQKKRK